MVARALAGAGVAGFFLLLGPTVDPLVAKRVAPTPVKPVSAQGVEYRAVHERIPVKRGVGGIGFRAFVEAIDLKTKKRLWKVQVYHVVFDPNLESDVQDVYIKSLALERGRVLVTTEKGKKYLVDVGKRTVHELKPQGKENQRQSGDKDEPRAFPRGSEKAVAVVRAAIPKADIDEVAEPKSFGGSGGKGTPLFWKVRLHLGSKKHELSVTPEGVIIRLPVPVQGKDLPKPVADAVARAAPGATVKSADRNEVRATLRYVALDRPRVQQYAVDVSKGGKSTRFVVSPDGKSARATAIRAEKKAARPAKEFTVPAKAARAVAALKALYPDLAVLKITHEVFDDGTGDIEILTYEVEFVSRGIEREMVASPEGVIPHLWAPVAAKGLPKAVTDALDRAAPGAKVVKARAFEIRASLRFGALAKAKVYYTVQVEKDGRERTLRVKPGGDLIQKFRFPKK